jgi:homoserine dehydrogenase
MEEIESRYYLRLQVEDKPGVIAKLADILGKKEISISSFIQREGQSAEKVSLLILTHNALENSVNEAVAEMEKMSEVRGKIKLFRIEDM